MITKEEILSKHYKKYEQRIAYPENVFAAMEEYTNQDKWISVRDELPEKGLRVLLYGHELGVCSVVAHLSTTGTWVDPISDKIVYIKRVTHWQPLPNPPKNL